MTDRTDAIAGAERRLSVTERDQMRAERDEVLMLLRRIDGWIRNWEPNFTDDDEWLEFDAPRLAAILAKHAKGEQP